MKEFILKSKQYPYWWYNIGTGYPRNIFKRILANTIGCNGYYQNKYNPIYKFFNWLYKEKNIRDIAVFIPNQVNVPKNFYSIPFYKILLMKLLNNIVL